LRRLCGPAVVLLWLSVLAGCGDDSVRPAAPATAAATTTTTATPTTTSTAAPTTTTTTTATITTAAATTTTTSAAPTTTTTTAATTTTRAAVLDTAALEAFVSTRWPPSWAWMEGIKWECRVVVPDGGSLVPGAVAQCAELLPPWDDSQFEVLTVLVLDQDGSLAVTWAGTVQLRLNPDYLVYELGTGASCDDLAASLAQVPDFHGDPRIQYFAVVLYWFVEGRPARMDAYGDGRPCEDLFPSQAVDDIWAGGWLQVPTP